MTKKTKQEWIERMKHHPLREKPLYSERVGKDGYIEIKYANVPKGGRGANWKNKQVFIYEQFHNVKVNSKKDVVIFLDNNKYNFDIDNLMLIPRRALVTLNRLYKFSDDREENLANIYRTMIKLKMMDLAEKCGLVYKYGNCRILRIMRNKRMKEWREKKKNEDK